MAPVESKLRGLGVKSTTEYLTFTIPARMAFLNITPRLEEIVQASDIQEGLLLCNPRQR